MAWYERNDPKAKLMGDSFPTIVDMVVEQGGF